MMGGDSGIFNDGSVIVYNFLFVDQAILSFRQA